MASASAFAFREELGAVRGRALVVAVAVAACAGYVAETDDTHAADATGQPQAPHQRCIVSDYQFGGALLRFDARGTALAADQRTRLSEFAQRTVQKLPRSPRFAYQALVSTSSTVDDGEEYKDRHALSVARAETVRDLLVLHGIPVERIVIDPDNVYVMGARRKTASATASGEVDIYGWEENCVTSPDDKVPVPPTGIAPTPW